MKEFIHKLLGSAQKYTVWDFGALKLCLLALGILLGAYFAPFFLKYTVIVWVVFIVCFFWVLYSTFFKHTNTH